MNVAARADLEASAPAARALVLASSSPRRRELLASLGLEFLVRPADIDERPRADEEAVSYVERLAREKAQAEARPGELVLGADTVVVLDGELLGKPRDAPEAEVMLARLSGREHVVATGVALADPLTERAASSVTISRVRMARMTREEIQWYVATGEPLDKAGSYGIQGNGALFVEEVAGNYTNVVGLPVPALYRLFTELGFELRGFRRT